MSGPVPHALELREYRLREIEKPRLSEAEGTLLWSKYGKQLDVQFPSPKTNDLWQITSQGWVGHVPVSESLMLRLAPKVPVTNIFGMWEYAYQFKAFDFLSSLVGLSRLDEFFEQLAGILAKRVLDRARRGFYRAYVHEADQLPYVRGELRMRERLRRPWQVRLPCRFEEHTADIDENQILLWTLQTIMRGYCSERVLPTVRKAYRALAGMAQTVPHGADACVNRLYNRLNQDYEPLHALCRFFLDSAGPTHDVGDRQMMPFLVEMSGLFERFVTEWLRVHAPDHWSVRRQETVDFGQDNDLRFFIDIVIRDLRTDRPLFVLDTKYKAPESPASSDVEQIVAYAESIGCNETALVYPRPLPRPLDVRVGEIHVRSLTFDLDGKLDEAGEDLLRELGAPR